MKVIVLGSGIVGTTSAWYLAQAGHEVVVVDRETDAALETSYANAGQISPGYSAPWAAPGVPLKAVKWMFMEHAPLAIRAGKMDADMLRWMWQMLLNCSEARYAVNKERMMRLAEYSRDQFIALRAATGIRYDDRQQGTLQIFRTQKQFDAAGKDIAVLAKLGVAHEVLDRKGCVLAEPALGLVCDKVVGGLRLPGDETGDCRQFTQKLARLAQAAGVEFRFGTPILGIQRSGDRITGIDTPQGVISGDAYVCSLGSYSTAFLRQLDIEIPVYPIKGYSLTIPMLDPAMSPRSTIMDEQHKVAITWMGERIRAAGTAELTGFDTRLRDERRATLEFVVNDLFPKGGDLPRAEFWSGLRPNTPDGTPIIGRSKYQNLWLNTGHGTLGWTMSCGSGRVLADLLSGRAAEIDTAGLGLERYVA